MFVKVVWMVWCGVFVKVVWMVWCVCERGVDGVVCNEMCGVVCL